MNSSQFKRLNKMLEQNTPLFDIERNTEIVDTAHVLITNNDFQSTNTKIFQKDVLIDPDGRRYVVDQVSTTNAGQVLGSIEVSTVRPIHQTINNNNIGRDAVIGNNNIAFNTDNSHNVSTIINETKNSALSDDDKAELKSILESIETSPALPKGFLAKFADFFEGHPKATVALGNLLTKVILGI